MASLGTEISARDLPAWFIQGLGDSNPAAKGDSRLLGVAEFSMTLDYAATISGFEREYLVRALARFRGRVNQTARAIGMNKSTLLRRIRAYELGEKA